MKHWHDSVSYSLFNFHKDERSLAGAFRIGHCLAALNVPNVTYTLHLNSELNHHSSSFIDQINLVP